MREAPAAWEQAGQHKVTHLPSGAHSTSRLRGDKASSLGTRWLLWEPFLCVLRAEPWRHPSTLACPPCSPGCHRDPLSYGLCGCLTQCRPQRLGNVPFRTPSLICLHFILNFSLHFLMNERSSMGQEKHMGSNRVWL